MLCAGHGPAASGCVRGAATTVPCTSPRSNLMEVKDVAKCQGMSVTAFPEEACARVRTSRTRGATNRNRVRRAEGGTSLQHKTKSSIHHMPDARRPGARAWKAAGFTPGGPRCVRFRTELSARPAHRTVEVSRGRSRWSNEPEGPARTRKRERTGRSHTHRRPERSPARMGRVNESG